jgi:hypothetical protein
LDNGQKSEHVITQDKNHIPWNKYHIQPLRKPHRFSCQSYRSLTGKRQRPTKGIWYLWVNKFSYLLYPHAINVLLYRMKPRKHIYRYVKYCWQAYFKSIGTLSQIFKNHIVTVAFKWCIPSASEYPVHNLVSWLLTKYNYYTSYINYHE